MSPYNLRNKAHQIHHDTTWDHVVKHKRQIQEEDSNSEGSTSTIRGEVNRNGAASEHSSTQYSRHTTPAPYPTFAPLNRPGRPYFPFVAPHRPVRNIETQKAYAPSWAETEPGSQYEPSHWSATEPGSQYAPSHWSATEPGSQYEGDEPMGPPQQQPSVGGPAPGAPVRPEPGRGLQRQYNFFGPQYLTAGPQKDLHGTGPTATTNSFPGAAGEATMGPFQAPAGPVSPQVPSAIGPIRNTRMHAPHRDSDFILAPRRVQQPPPTAHMFFRESDGVKVTVLEGDVQEEDILRLVGARPRRQLMSTPPRSVRREVENAPEDNEASGSGQIPTPRTSPKKTPKKTAKKTTRKTPHKTPRKNGRK